MRSCHGDFCLLCGLTELSKKKRLAVGTDFDKEEQLCGYLKIKLMIHKVAL
jgi:hypothetical protein